MSEAEASDICVSQVDLSVDFSATMASLRLAGADQFDPVRLHYLQMLAIRANGQSAAVKRLLGIRLVQGLATYRARFEEAQSDARDAIVQAARHHPQASGDLQRLFTLGDLKAVKRRVATLKSNTCLESLGDLTRSVSRHSQHEVDKTRNAKPGKSLARETTQYFRETWSRLSVGRRLAQELAQAPKNAGPINSHLLVLRSLEKMRDISPDYLNRFTSYVDTLLSLDQCDKEKQASTRKAASSDSGQKTKNRRTKVL